ncbi:MAG: glycosyltransferase family protein [Ignavibacteriae bacterium]|nr:glycosyltransferase family protein [Ignavibacteriota bacterium]
MNILIVIQARRGSSRLPDKVLLPLKEKPLLLRMYERVEAAKVKKQIVIATTTEKEDDVIADLCRENKINFFRGHPLDLLDRHYKAALEYKADVVVKIPSDCPLICPDVIDNVLDYYIENKSKFDFVSNLHPATHPDGNDVEVIPVEILKAAWEEAKQDFEREHTTPFIWDHPERFRIGNVEWETGLDFSKSHRFTIDHKEDYDFIKRIYEELYDENKVFTLCDIMMLLDRKPEIRKLNEKYAGQYWYDGVGGRLKTVGR